MFFALSSVAITASTSCRTLWMFTGTSLGAGGAPSVSNCSTSRLRRSISRIMTPVYSPISG